MLEEDGDDVGFTNMSDGCFRCQYWEGNKLIRPAIVPRGKWMCCEKCGGGYGSVPEKEQGAQ